MLPSVAVQINREIEQNDDITEKHVTSEQQNLDVKFKHWLNTIENVVNNRNHEQELSTEASSQKLNRETTNKPLYQTNCKTSRKRKVDKYVNIESRVIKTAQKKQGSSTTEINRDNARETEKELETSSIPVKMETHTQPKFKKNVVGHKKNFKSLIPRKVFKVKFNSKRISEDVLAGISEKIEIGPCISKSKTLDPNITREIKKEGEETQVISAIVAKVKKARIQRPRVKKPISSSADIDKSIQDVIDRYIEHDEVSNTTGNDDISVTQQMSTFKKRKPSRTPKTVANTHLEKKRCNLKNITISNAPAQVSNEIHSLLNVYIKEEVVDDSELEATCLQNTVVQNVSVRLENICLNETLEKQYGLSRKFEELNRYKNNKPYNSVNNGIETSKSDLRLGFNSLTKASNLEILENRNVLNNELAVRGKFPNVKDSKYLSRYRIFRCKTAHGNLIDSPYRAEKDIGSKKTRKSFSSRESSSSALDDSLLKSTDLSETTVDTSSSTSLDSPRQLTKIPSPKKTDRELGNSIDTFLKQSRLKSTKEKVSSKNAIRNHLRSVSDSDKSQDTSLRNGANNALRLSGSSISSFEHLPVASSSPPIKFNDLRMPHSNIGSLKPRSIEALSSANQRSVESNLDSSKPTPFSIKEITVNVPKITNFIITRNVNANNCVVTAVPLTTNPQPYSDVSRTSSDINVSPAYAVGLEEDDYDSEEEYTEVEDETLSERDQSWIYDFRSMETHNITSHDYWFQNAELQDLCLISPEPPYILQNVTISNTNAEMGNEPLFPTRSNTEASSSLSDITECSRSVTFDSDRCTKTSEMKSTSSNSTTSSSCRNLQRVSRAPSLDQTECVTVSNITRTVVQPTSKSCRPNTITKFNTFKTPLPPVKRPPTRVALNLRKSLTENLLLGQNSTNVQSTNDHDDVLSLYASPSIIINPANSNADELDNRSNHDLDTESLAESVEKVDINDDVNEELNKPPQKIGELQQIHPNVEKWLVNNPPQNFLILPTIFKGLCRNYFIKQYCRFTSAECKYLHKIDKGFYENISALPYHTLVTGYDFAKIHSKLYQGTFYCLVDGFAKFRSHGILVQFIADVLKCEIYNKTPFVDKIVNSLCELGIPFVDAIEEIFLAHQHERTSLGNILLEIVCINRKQDLCTNWCIVGTLIQDRTEPVDHGLISDLLGLCCEDHNIELAINIVQDIITPSRVDFKEIHKNSLNDFLAFLRFANLNSEVNVLLHKIKLKSLSSCSNLSSPTTSNTTSMQSSFQNNRTPVSVRSNHSIHGLTEVADGYDNVKYSNTNTNELSPLQTEIELDRNVNQVKRRASKSYSNSVNTSNSDVRNYDSTEVLEVDEESSSCLVRGSRNQSEIYCITPEIDELSDSLPSPLIEPQTEVSFEELVNVNDLPPAEIPLKILNNTEILPNTTVLELKKVIDQEQTFTFLNMLVKCKDTVFSRAFVLNTLVYLKTKSADDIYKFLNELVRVLGDVNSRFLEDVNTKKILCSLYVNAMGIFEQHAEYTMASSFLSTFKDSWDELLETTWFNGPHRYSYSNSGKYLYFAKIFTKSHNVRDAWAILTKPELKFLYGNSKWPLLHHGSFDRNLRDYVLEELIKISLVKDLYFAHDVIMRLLNDGNVNTEIDKWSYFNTLILKMLKNKAMYLNNLKNIINDVIDGWFRYLSPPVLRKLLIKLLNNISEIKAVDLYDACCKQQCYPYLNGNEQSLTLNLTMTISEIYMTFLVYFYKKAKNNFPLNNLAVIIDEPRIDRNVSIGSANTLQDLHMRTCRVLASCFSHTICATSNLNTTTLEISTQQLQPCYDSYYVNKKNLKNA